MKKKISIIFLALFILFLFCDINFSEDDDNNKRVVRVGWFESEGIHKKDSEGNYFGYDYEFLTAIAQHANWEYEYYEGSWTECYEALINGEIDLLGIVNKNPEREELFDFAYTSSGMEFCCLYTRENNDKYTYTDFKEFDGMRIGVEANTYQAEVLKEYARTNDFEYTQISYPTLFDATKSIDSGEIDAFLASSTDLIEGYKRIAQFNPVEFYYAVKKGNNDLLVELNNALNSLLSFDPSFASDLYDNYFVDKLTENIVFSEEEQKFIDSNPEIYILYDPAWFPIEYYNKKNKKYEGIVPEIIELIEKNSGIEVQEVLRENSVEVLKELRENKKNNYITSISYDYGWANKNHVSITQPFSKCNILQVSMTDKKDKKTVALVELDYITEKVKENFKDYDPLYYKNVYECLEAVKSGEADTTYINNYQAEYYLRLPDYKALSFYNVDSFNQKLCFGVSDGSNPLVLSIISKSLKRLSVNELSNIVYKNTNIERDLSLIDYVKENPVEFLRLFLIVFAFVLVIIAIFMISKLKISKQIEVENERYNLLSEISNEQLFEYSFNENILYVKNELDDFFEGFKSEESGFDDCEDAILNTSPKCKLYKLIRKCEDVDEDISVVKSGKVTWYNVKIKIIKNKNKVLYAIGKVYNIDEEIKEKEILIDKSKRDLMTGLYNKDSFNKIIGELLKLGGTLLIVDIDNFKSINDTHGHMVGDEVIVSIGDILHKFSRNTDIAGRIGGDELSLFLPELVRVDLVNELCKKINKEVKNIDIHNLKGEISVSIGAAVSQGDLEYKKIFEMADKALYKVKNDNKDGFYISENIDKI